MTIEESRSSVSAFGAEETRDSPLGRRKRKLLDLLEEFGEEYDTGTVDASFDLPFDAVE